MIVWKIRKIRRKLPHYKYHVGIPQLVPNFEDKTLCQNSVFVKLIKRNLKSYLTAKMKASFKCFRA